MFKRFKELWNRIPSSGAYLRLSPHPNMPRKVRVSNSDLDEALGWLEGALNCKMFNWDGDQWEAAARCHDRLAIQAGVPQLFQQVLNAPVPEVVVTYGEPAEIEAFEDSLRAHDIALSKKDDHYYSRAESGWDRV